MSGSSQQAGIARKVRHVRDVPGADIGPIQYPSNWLLIAYWLVRPKAGLLSAFTGARNIFAERASSRY